MRINYYYYMSNAAHTNHHRDIDALNEALDRAAIGDQEAADQLEDLRNRVALSIPDDSEVSR